MSYTVILKNGRSITIQKATSHKVDGQGHHLMDENGADVGFFQNGDVSACYPSDSDVKDAEE